MSTETPFAAPAPSPLADRELSISRVIDAPRSHVYRTWTTRLPAWWGPHGMTTPVCEMDLRPGGIFRTVMRAPDGTEYPTRGVFLEVVPDERIVFTDAFEPGWEPSTDIFFTCVTTFTDAGPGQTRVTSRAWHWNAANREKHAQMGFHAGWGQSFERFAAAATAPA